MPERTIISVDPGASDPDAAIVVAKVRDGVIRVEPVVDLDAIRTFVLSVAERMKPVFDAMRAEVEAMCTAMRPVVQLPAELREQYPDPADWVIEPEPEGCHHLCGRNPGHECTGEADGTFAFQVGGREIPMCAPCRGAAAVTVERRRERALESAEFRDWPADAGNVCAHVCGGDSGHVCDARATTSLTYDLPSGGKRTMPMCGACKAAESVGGDG